MLFKGTLVILSAGFVISYMTSNGWLFFTLALLTMYATAIWYNVVKWTDNYPTGGDK